MVAVILVGGVTTRSLKEATDGKYGRARKDECIVWLMLPDELSFIICLLMNFII